jgi:hypothetical protein
VWLYLETEHSFRCHCVADVGGWPEAMERAQSILDGDVGKVIALFPEHIARNFPHAAALTCTIEAARRRVRRWLYDADLDAAADVRTPDWTQLEPAPALAAVSS